VRNPATLHTFPRVFLSDLFPCSGIEVITRSPQVWHCDCLAMTATHGRPPTVCQVAAAAMRITHRTPTLQRQPRSSESTRPTTVHRPHKTARRRRRDCSRSRWRSTCPALAGPATSGHGQTSASQTRSPSTCVASTTGNMADPRCASRCCSAAAALCRSAGLGSRWSLPSPCVRVARCSHFCGIQLSAARCEMPSSGVRFCSSAIRSFETGRSCRSAS